MILRQKGKNPWGNYEKQYKVIIFVFSFDELILPILPIEFP